MKIRVVSLCFLTLFSVAAHAQDGEEYGEARLYSEPTRKKIVSPNIVVAPVPKIPTQNLISKYCATKQFVVSDVPKEFSESITLTSPVNNSSVVKKTVVVEGKNAYLTPTFVNGHQVALQNDGSFYVEQELDAYGRFAVYCTFTTPDQRFFTVKRDGVVLLSPPDIDNFVLNKKQLISFFNSPYFYNSDSSRLLSDPFTRADLAFFTSKLRGFSPRQKLPGRFQDVPENAWFSQSVLFDVRERIMSEFPDGLFRPQQSVTKLEFILTVVRALRLDLDQSTSELPFRDVPSNHWSAKFIRTALREGIIKPDTTLNPNSSLVLSDFMTLAQGISVVRKTLATTSENLAPVPVATRNVEAFLYPIILAIKDQKPRVPAIQKSIQFSSPKTNDVTLGDFVRFEGVILPSEPFNIGSFQVVPSPDGRFVCAVPLVLGKNDFSATVFNTTSTFHLFRLQPYDDLKGHWSEMTAAKLRFLRVLDDEQAFKPNKVITREEFVVWLSRALDWPMEPVEVPRIPSDLDKTSQNYLAYLKALQLGVVSVDERGLFRPKATMNKAELITALTQAVPLQLFPVAYTGPFPFADVSSKHWARTSVEQGLKTGLIAPSPMFSPRHEVTRAELAMMLYRLPSVQTRLDSAISHD